MKKAVVLLSGGLDSSTALYIAKKQGYEIYALIFDYGQRHSREIESAKKQAVKNAVSFKIVKISLPWKGSALLDNDKKVPVKRKILKDKIPSTYVPSRNTIFLSFALSWAEVIGAEKIFIGANVMDYSGYPDCRPGYFDAMSKVYKKGTKAGTEGKKLKIETPLINMSKADIIKKGTRLGVPFEMTWSCYKGGKRPCGKCDSCVLRAKGFREAGLEDPLL